MVCLKNDVLKSKDHNHIYDYLMLTNCLYLEMGSWGQPVYYSDDL